MDKTSKQKLAHRLKIIGGQVRGLEGMLGSDSYCIDIITQKSEVKHALAGIEDALMQNHLSTCVVHQMKKGKENTAIGEILKVYKLKRR